MGLDMRGRKLGGQAGGDKPAEFMSTHPSDETRIRQLSERLNVSMPIYEQARAAGKSRLGARLMPAARVALVRQMLDVVGLGLALRERLVPDRPADRRARRLSQGLHRHQELD